MIPKSNNSKIGIAKANSTTPWERVGLIASLLPSDWTRFFAGMTIIIFISPNVWQYY
jgi:hypothetical protein